MVVNFIKFFHLLATLALVGFTLTAFLMLIQRKSMTTSNLILTKLNKLIFATAGLAILTGTLLVYPKQFTFQTPWIQAAYLLMLSFLLGLGILIFNFKKKWSFVGYFFLVAILLVVIHDAVTKSTYF